jgi:hypothetical protein
MKVLTSTIEITSGIVANTNGNIRRSTAADAAVANTTARTTIGPVQPRMPNAIAASANARTSLVVGFSPA